MDVPSDRIGWCFEQSGAHAVLCCAMQVTAIFRSSVEVMISVWGEQPELGEMFHCGDAYATIVSGVQLMFGDISGTASCPIAVLVK